MLDVLIRHEQGGVMADNDTRAVMEGYLQALRDRAAFDQFFATDVTWTTMETGEQIHGREQVRDLIVGLHTQAFDARPELGGLVTGDGSAMLEARFVGEHTGEFGGLAATGRHVDVPYCVAYDVAGGQITALRAYMPVAALRAQLVEAAEPATTPA
jgi:ketosteroid isomerase-like protein